MTTLGELAKVLELELRGDPARSIASLAALESATAGDLSFVSEKKHLHKVSDTSAGALILHPDWEVKKKSEKAYKAATSTKKELESKYGMLNKGGLMRKR